MAHADARGSDAPWVRGVATLLGTLLVVVLEFALLTAVYHSGDGARERHEDYVGASSALAAWAPGAPLAPVTRAFTRLDEVTGADADGVRAALQQWQRSPLDAADRGRLRSTTDRLGDRLAAEKRFADERAAGIHAGLLVLASVGWFLWFRRVVRRHRDLEHTLTEAKAVVAGEQRLMALVSNSSDMVAVLDPDTTISYASPSIRTVTGRDPQRMLGRSLLDVAVAEDVATLTSLLSLQSLGEHPLTMKARHVNGREPVLEGTLNNLLDDEAVGGWVLTLRDVTDRNTMQDELSRQALHDSLTGLANRRLFSDRLDHALRRRGADAEPLVVLFLDLDDFKNVNDSHGHGTGDRLLVAVAERVADTIRQADTAARLGGDEFAVLLEEIEPDEARETADRLLSIIAEPIVLDDVEYVVRASVGMAVALPGLTSGEEALRNADVAMYWAKDSGKRSVAVYDAARHAEAMAQLELRAALSQAIAEDQLVLHYQPTVDLVTGQYLAFEALVRWQHPVHGLLYPGAFVEIAERSGLIVPMGMWVLREAARAAVGDPAVGTQLPHVGVNVAARQFADPDFVDQVTAILAETGLEPWRLTLEITETTLLTDRDSVVGALTTLRQLGVTVAVDDFGTGYSSLSYLADLPVDVLKIDKSFVDTICDDGAALVEAIVGLAESLRLLTVAEGVEEPEQAQRLREARCRVGQGYLWSRPVPLCEAYALLAESDLPFHVSGTPLPDPFTATGQGH